MIGSRALRGQSRPALAPQLLLSFALALPLAALSIRVAPKHGFTSLAAAVEFIAIGGGLWAAYLAWRRRGTPELRRPWIYAAVGALLIAAARQIEARPFALEASAPAGALVSAALWICAGYLIFACGRRYAMRRHVVAVIQAAVAVEILALALSGPLAGVDPAVARLQEACELLSVFLFVSGLALTQFAPLKSYRFPPDEVGKRARRLLYDFGIEAPPRYPAPYPVLFQPVARHLFIIVMIAWFAPQAARAASRASGRGVGKQLLDMLRLGFVERIDAKSYYVHDLYRAPARASETLTRVETKNGINRALQQLRANRPGPRDMNDKLAFWRACEANGVASAPILACVEGGRVERLADLARFDGDLFVKERSGRGGRFTLNFERVGPLRYRDDRGFEIGLEDLLARLQKMSEARRLMVQPKLRNHPAISALADQSLIVFRVMTCMDAYGAPRVTHGVMRLLRRFEPRWPKTPDSDWGCAVDVATGAFGLLTGDAPATASVWFERHPVTGEQVAGRVLQEWGAIAELALRAHRVFASRVLVGWDIALTPDGPVILEGNSNPDFSYIQRVTRTPVGRSQLGALLNVHLDALTAQLLERTAARDR